MLATLTAKPVYMTRPRMRRAAGARAWARDRLREAIDRKSMDMTIVRVKLMSIKKKYGPVWLLAMGLSVINGITHQVHVGDWS